MKWTAVSVQPSGRPNFDYRASIAAPRMAVGGCCRRAPCSAAAQSIVTQSSHSQSACGATSHARSKTHARDGTHDGGRASQVSSGSVHRNSPSLPSMVGAGGIRRTCAARDETTRRQERARLIYERLRGSRRNRCPRRLRDRTPSPHSRASAQRRHRIAGPVTTPQPGRTPPQTHRCRRSRIHGRDARIAVPDHAACETFLSPWNCSSSVDPVSAVVEDWPCWIACVTASK